MCSVLCVLCCFILLRHGTFSVLQYSSVLLRCSLLFILQCSYCYVCVFDCIYCTSTLPQGVNPIAVNKYRSVLKMIRYRSLNWFTRNVETCTSPVIETTSWSSGTDKIPEHTTSRHESKLQLYITRRRKRVNEFPALLHVDRTESMDLLYHNTSMDLTHILSQHRNCRLLSQSSSQDTKI